MILNLRKLKMIFVDWFLQKKQWLKMYDAWKCSLMLWCQDICAFRIWCQHTTWWYDMQMVMHDRKHVFLFLSTRNQNIIVEIKIMKCMNAWWKTCYALPFWKFLLESIVLFSIIKLIVVEICRMKIDLFWNGVMIARDSWQGVQTLVAMFSKRRNKLLKLW